MTMVSIARDGKNFGNFSEDAVREGLRSGRFLLTDLAWREGMATWQPLSQFSEFASVQPGGTPPPTPPLAPTTPLPPVSGVATSRTEPLAIWSLVLSLVGLFCCGLLFGVPGIICGYMARSKIQKNPALQGQGLATAGLVIGYVGVAFWLIYIVFFGGMAVLEGITQGIQK
jgi:hypothetical protein